MIFRQFASVAGCMQSFMQVLKCKRRISENVLSHDFLEILEIEEVSINGILVTLVSIKVMYIFLESGGKCSLHRKFELISICTELKHIRCHSRPASSAGARSLSRATE